MFAPIALVILFASEGLAFWINEEFARQSAGVLRWLALGVFINCFARLPFIALQSYGRPDLTAKLHLIELPIYMVSLWFLLRQYGLMGAAICWTLRIILDTLFLFLLNMKVIPALRNVSFYALRNTTIVALTLFAISLAQSMAIRVILGGVFVMMMLIANWFTYHDLKNKYFAN
jgi:O-antigen/teichoic acid export membrane protein